MHNNGESRSLSIPHYLLKVTFKSNKNMKVRLAFVCICLFSVFISLTGCSRQEEKQKAEIGNSQTNKSARVQGKSWKLSSLSNESVLMRCGTNELTKGEMDRVIDLRVKMLQMSVQNGQKIKRSEAFESRMLAALPVVFPRECAIADFAATNGIDVGDGELKLMRSRAMQGAKQRFITWTAFLKKFTKQERELLEERVRIEALQECVRKWHVKNKPAKLSDEEIARFRKRQREYNDMAAATNRLVFANATNVWKSLKAGLAFDEAVRSSSTLEDNSENGEWGDFQLDYFKDEPEVRSAIEALDVGGFTLPIESDNGLAIIRLDNKHTENGMIVYSLSRIFFHLPEFYPELDDAEFAKELREARQDRLFNEFLTELAKKLPVTYPNGEKIFEEANRIASQPALF